MGTGSGVVVGRGWGGRGRGLLHSVWPHTASAENESKYEPHGM